MPEGNAGGNGQAPTANSGNGQAPTQGTPPAGNDQASASNTETFTPPDAETWKRHQSELAEARREAASLRKAQTEAENAKLSDSEKRDKRLADLEKAHSDLQRSHQDRVLQYEVRLSAAAANFRDPADALSLIDLAAVKFDDDGQPKNLNELIEAIAKSKPYLLREDASAAPTTPAQRQATAGGATNPGRTSTNGGAKIPLSHEYINSLIATNPQEYVNRGEEIRQWLIAHPLRGGRF